LYFISADNKLMAVEVKGGGKKFDAGVPNALFAVPGQAQFDVGKDGRFLIHVPVDQAAASVPLTDEAIRSNQTGGTGYRRTQELSPRKDQPRNRAAGNERNKKRIESAGEPAGYRPHS
jgi:hypothetical protein